jgi:hypothetical protein
MPGWTPTHQAGPGGLSCHEGDARRSVATVQSVRSQSGAGAVGEEDAVVRWGHHHLAGLARAGRLI